MTSVKRHLMLMTWVTDRTVELFIRNRVIDIIWNLVNKMYL